ncbi:MAG: rRNA adenine N-6-methyltransferase family protein [Wenzhouxiangellaceae bacterium]
MSNVLKLWAAWLRGPQTVGAVAPSSPQLARRMLETIHRPDAGLVVEVGAGTGPITRVLSQKLPPQRLIVVERDPQLCAHLREDFPDYRIVEADAGELCAHVEGISDQPVTAVVSALPLLSLNAGLRSRIIAQIAQLIGDHGQLVQFTYGWGSPVPASDARAHGLIGQRAGFVWRNLPPAMVWSYQRQPGKTSP